MTKDEIVKEIAEEFRTNVRLRHRLGIGEGESAEGIPQQEGGPDVAISWVDPWAGRVVVQVFTASEDL